MNKIERKILLGFISVSILIQLISFHSKWRTVLSTYFQNNDRQVLSKVDGQFKKLQAPIRIIKYFEGHDLFIEAYLKSQTPQKNI